jgi:hypothetical protein
LAKLPAPGPKRWSIVRKPSERIAKPYHLVTIPVEGFVGCTSHTDMAGLANALVSAQTDGPIRWVAAFHGKKLELSVQTQQIVSVNGQEVVVEQECDSLTTDEGGTRCSGTNAITDLPP